MARVASYQAGLLAASDYAARAAVNWLEDCEAGRQNGGQPSAIRRVSDEGW